MPGSAPTPAHVPWLRVAYGAVGLLVGVTGGLGNALVTVNLPQLQGALGLDTVQGAWLPVAFVMTSAWASMLLLKMRQQFGLQTFAKWTLSIYLALLLAGLLAHDFRSEFLVRCASGLASAGLNSLGFLYMIQAFPARHRLKALAVGVGLSSLALPLARIASPSLLQLGGWQGLYLFEAGLALLSFGAVTALRLPPSDRFQAFRWADIITFGLFAPGVAMLCAALGLGRVVWWTEAPWVGYALCGAIVLIVLAFTFEHNRRHPFLNTRWMGQSQMIRLALAAMLVRFILSEQTYGSVGLMTTLGMGPDQLRSLYLVILLATVAGIVVSALVLDPTRLGGPMLAALAIMAVGSFMDADATNLTHPHQIYLTQGMLAFAAALFLAPALLFGIAKVLEHGAGNIVSFIATFSLSQSMGGLAGSALLGSLQVVREKFHSNQIVDHLNPANPVVAHQFDVYAGAYAHVLTDPALRAAEGHALVSQLATREANILAFNDVFFVIGVIATITFLWIAAVTVRQRLRTRAQALAAAQANPNAGQL